MIIQSLLYTVTIMVFLKIIMKQWRKFLGVDQITPLLNAELQRVPLFIHVPGVKGGVQHQYGGEVDVRPTLLHLLGIDTKDYMEFGSDLLSQQTSKLGFI